MNKIFDNKQEFTELYRDAVMSISGKSVEAASDLDRFNALAKLVAEKARTVATKSDARATAEGKKRVYYFSIEFLIGRLLDNYLLNFGVRDMVAEALDDMGFNLSVIENQEPDPALGNGGLGRLAACFLDSMAAEGIAGYGNGMRYRYGLFKQEIVNGSQVEATDEWLTHGYPWEVRRQDKAVTIKFGGHVEGFEENGRTFYRTVDTQDILAVPYDIPVVGYAGETVNKLRVWAAEPVEEHFDLEAFNRGDYAQADAERAEAEAISAILYPNDAGEHGRLLRLKQEYLFVSAGIYSLLDTFEKEHGENWELLPQFVAIHTNDTHPAMCGPELMRILIDEYGYDWDTAWSITTKTFNYTCHTLLPEALEVWPAKLISELLPRHMEIINEINEHFLAELKTKTRDKAKIERMRIVTDEENPKVRMAYLATAGGSHVNGVAELHSELLKDVTLRDFSDLYGDKFTNVTNGVTPRRFIRLANPRLSALITEGLGTDKWLSDLELLKGLEPLAKDDEFVKKFAAVKQANKEDFTAYAKREYGFDLDPNTMFNTMVKRLHEYKRQSLKILALIAKYADIKSGRVSADDVLPRTVIFGAKSAPGYYLAKMTIQLINNVARVVNNDPDVKGKLHVFFPWNYNVRLAQHLIPATDLDEQISQAGKEASGTGNMKFALNGALTVGTLDGANVEIRERVGAENFFLFGMTVDEVDKLYENGYSPAKYYEADPRLKAAIDMVSDGTFSNGDRNTYAPLVADWLTKDWFMTLADFTAYSSIQSEIEALYRDPLEWNRKAVLNVANSGYFSSDRSIQDYLDNIWHTSPLA